MTKKNALWIAAVLTLCCLAAFTAFAALEKSSNAMTAANAPVMASTGAAQSVPMSPAQVADLAKLPTKAGAVNHFEGREGHKNAAGVSVSQFVEDHRTGTVNLTSDLLPGMADQIRDENNSLDILCNIIQGATAASGFVNASAGMAFTGWINPGPSCAGSPDFPYRVDSVRFQVANAAAFGITGAAGAGTATYRVNLYSTSNCSADSCANPGNVLCSSTTISWTTANTAGQLVNLTVPLTCCVNGPFFASIEYLSWTGAGDNGGTGGAFRSLWPSLLWNSTARPLCEQWVFNGCAWVDHSSFFNPPANGYYLVTVYGESNVGCTPVTCSTEQLCDVTCPGGATAEGEPTCANEYVDVTNGGCFAVAENFGTIDCGETICGTSGTFTVGGVNSSDDDFFEFTITQTSDVSFSVTAEFCSIIAIFDAGPTGFECDSAVVLGSTVEQPCSTATLVGRLEPGTYYAYVSTALVTGVPCGAVYYASLECDLVTCIPNHTANVTCAGATPPIQGSTVGAGDPCAIGNEGELWELTITQAGSYNFKGCNGPEAYDQYLYLFDEANCCVAFTAEDDDLCGTVGGLSFMRCVDLTPGTYFLLVTGFAPGDVGQYAIQVSCCQPCPITCADNETEVDCGDGFVGTNEGCNASPPTFETIACGDTKCGSYGYYTRNDSSFRDLDWYKVSLAQDSRLTVTAQSELENAIWITTDCPSTTIAFSSAFECSTHTISACVPAGDYYILTAPLQGLESAPCGSRYTLSLSCVPCTVLNDCPGESAVSQPITLPTENWTFGVSDVIGDLKRYESFTLPVGETGFDAINFWGIVTQSANFNLCEENPMTFSIQVWADNAGAPDIAAGPVCSITTQLTGDPSGLIYLDTYEALAYTYTWPTGTCCTLTSGWISIQGTSAGSPDDCRFLWASSGDSDLGSSLLYTAGVPQPTETFDLSMCLSPCPPPCDPILDLRVYLEVGNASAKLFFTAPQAANYVIYSTINANADDNPDGGSDPDYTVETTLPLPAGPATWTATAGFANVKKFVVVANCE